MNEKWPSVEKAPGKSQENNDWPQVEKQPPKMGDNRDSAESSKLARNHPLDGKKFEKSRGQP